MSPGTSRRAAWAARALSVLALASCEREQRASPVFAEAHSASLATDFQAGAGRPVQGLAIPAASPGRRNRFEESAHALAQGRRWYSAFNCAGCHGVGGGGGIGPALMDEEWTYGSDSAEIFASILGGRPNGMPAYGGRVPAEQAWQLAAYVRSLAGLVRSDVATGRRDGLRVSPPENSRDRSVPRPAAPEASR